MARFVNDGNETDDEIEKSMTKKRRVENVANEVLKKFMRQLIV